MNAIKISSERDKVKLESEIRERKFAALSKLYEDDCVQYNQLCTLMDLIIRDTIGQRYIRKNGQEIIDDIIEKLATGKRKWDIEKYPNAFNHIRFIMNNSIGKNLERDGIKIREDLRRGKIRIPETVSLDEKPSITEMANELSEEIHLFEEEERDVCTDLGLCTKLIEENPDEECQILFLYLKELKDEEYLRINEVLAKKTGKTKKEIINLRLKIQRYLIKKSIEMNQNRKE